MPKRHFNFFQKQENIWFDSCLTAILLSSIACYLTLRGWTNTCLFLLLAIAFLFIKTSYRNVFQHETSRLFWPLFITLSLPVTAIFVSQLGRNEWAFRDYDGPSRMLFAIPLLVYFVYRGIKYTRLIGFAAPMAMLLTTVSVYLHPEVVARWTRFATTFVDPNALGTYAVVFTAFCLFHLDVSLKSSKTWFLYQLGGVLLGLYLVIGSSTRGSWLAIPVIVGIWLFFNYRKISPLIAAILGIFSVVSLTVLLHYFPSFNARVLSGFSELASWINRSDIDTSTGLRLSMWKISGQLFLHNPLFGYGTKGYIAYLNEPWLASASAMAKETMLCCGPHNELLANTLRSGLIGAISVLCLFLIPLTLFVRNSSHEDPDVAKASQIGMAYISVLMICSLSMEVFNLKYTSTFYGLTIAGLFAQIIVGQINVKAHR